MRIGVLVLDQRDGLQATGHTSRHAVDDDPLRRDRDGLQPRSAMPADGQAADLLGQAGAQRGLAGDVISRGSLGAATTDDDVFDLRGLEPAARQGVADRMTGQRRAIGVVERATIRLADRRACR